MVFLMIGCLCGGYATTLLVWSHGLLTVLWAAPLGASAVTLAAAVARAFIGTPVHAGLIKASGDRVPVRLVAH